MNIDINVVVIHASLLRRILKINFKMVTFPNEMFAIINKAIRGMMTLIVDRHQLFSKAKMLIVGVVYLVFVVLS